MAGIPLAAWCQREKKVRMSRDVCLAGYDFNVLWSKPEQLPVVVTVFYDAVTVTAGLNMTFRLWLFGQPVNWTSLRDGSPPGVAFR